MEAAVKEAASLLGYSSLKEEQLCSIKAFMDGRDVFVILPTGFGKSACFTCLPHAIDVYQRRSPHNKSIIIVISPLTALICDQVMELLSKNISAGYLDHESSPETKKNAISGLYSILFMSPEQLVENWRCLFSSTVYKERLIGLIIDEAHCVVKWGLSFREAFTRIKEVRSLMPSSVGVMALTATASKPLREKVESLLGMRNPFTVVRSPEKRNITLTLSPIRGYNEYEVPKVFQSILEEISRKQINLPRIMIFCKRKTDCPKLYMYFKMCMGAYFTNPPGTSPDVVEARLVDMFFKGTDEDIKKRIIANFTKASNLRILICTEAFGMGINCHNVQLIIHYGVPSDPETYVQQIGRAGRNGENSFAIMLHAKHLMQNCEQPMIGYTKNKSSCRRQLLFRDFEGTELHSLKKSCKCCDICMKECKCKNCLESLTQSYIFLPAFFN